MNSDLDLEKRALKKEMDIAAPTRCHIVQLTTYTEKSIRDDQICSHSL